MLPPQGLCTSCSLCPGMHLPQISTGFPPPSSSISTETFSKYPVYTIISEPCPVLPPCLRKTQELEEYTCRMLAIWDIPPGKSLKESSPGNLAHLQGKKKKILTLKIPQENGQPTHSTMKPLLIKFHQEHRDTQKRKLENNLEI